MKKIFFLLYCLAPLLLQAQYYLVAGTYTSGKSEGIYVYRFDTAQAANQFVSVAAASNPSFLAVSPDEKFVYAVNENADSLNNGGSVSSYSFDKKTGTLHFLNSRSSGGNHPCYVETDKTGGWIFTGNYSSGTVGLFPVNNEGNIGEATQLVQHSGSGPNIQRQLGPHVHSTVMSANNRYLFVSDLGTDQLVSYRFKKRKLVRAHTVHTEPGSGPRHLAFSSGEKFLYLMEEMTATVACYKVKKGKMKLVQRIGAVPEGFTGVSGAADIHISPDGNFLYCSNRGDANNIIIFSIDNTSGRLALRGFQPVIGKKPRNFNFDPSGNFLLVANQDSDEIVIFKIDKISGMLSDTGKRIAVPNPVCIKWISP